MSLSVKTRILLLGMLPLLIALWFMGLVIVHDFQLMRSLKQVEPATYLNSLITAYIHEVQKERGATGIFLSSKGKKFQSELIQQRNLTDQAWQVLEQFISNHDITEDKTFNNNLQQAIQLARGLSALRKQVDTQSISFNEALDQYSAHNSQWLALIQESSRLTDNVVISQMRLTFAALARGKELAGIERAIVSSTFSRNVLTSAALKKTTYVIAEQQIYFNFFKALAASKQINFYEQKIVASVKDIKQLRDKVISKIDNLDRNVLVFQLYQAVGYGGAIHNFKNYVLRGKEKYYTRFMSNYEAIVKTIQQLEQLKNVSSSYKQALKNIKSVFMKYNLAIKQVKKLYMQDESIAWIDSMVKIDDTPALDGLKELINASSLGNFGVTAAYSFQVYSQKINALKAVEDFLLHDMENTGQQLSAQVQTHFYTLLIITILVVIVVLFAIFYVVNGITSPLSKAINFAQAIARNDLSRKLDINQKDEVGVLAQALNNMSDNLVQMVSQLANNSSTLNNYSHQMKQSSDEVSHSMEKQSHKTNETRVVAQGLVNDAEKVADMSSEAAQSAAKAGQTASEGGVVVTKAITSMREIADLVNQSADSVAELNTLGENISGIISVIEGIAEQTNLLALNAAIEAARAGEQGRGFAVVADEVRHLAQRTAEATHEVSESIKSIQDNTLQVSRQMQTGTERAAHSVELAGQASNALGDIVNQSKTVAEMIDSIAQASNRQVDEIGKISDNIQVIDELASQSMSAIKQAVKVALDLEGSAQSLDEQISLFKLS